LNDTPGHGKLRHHAFNALNTLAGAKAAPSTRNIIFVVDAADLSAASAGLRDAAEYLYDVLLAVQKAYESATTSKSRELHVLIAANKMDLFTALPTEVVKKSLERELSTLRETKAKGISAVGTVGKGEGLGGAEDEEGDKDVLGGMGEGPFTFAGMQEFDCQVDVIGGNVIGGDGPGVNGWWEWIALQM
jgi:signal recognition particle receptor subunit beta